MQRISNKKGFKIVRMHSRHRRHHINCIYSPYKATFFTVFRLLLLILGTTLPVQINIISSFFRRLLLALFLFLYITHLKLFLLLRICDVIKHNCFFLYIFFCTTHLKCPLHTIFLVIIIHIRSLGYFCCFNK